MATTYREKIIADINDIPDAKLPQFYTVLHTIKQQLFPKSDPAKPTSGIRQLGSAKGLISIADDFNAPLPDDITNEFYK
ncbi:MAG: hypothetical protein A2076_10910 [Geobacteraceae bacterium GWC2_53_11]|nr:MAG: hypothetical protein A2076_10910 [Geobacteraceae bacterium GWC2_53_11]